MKINKAIPSLLASGYFVQVHPEVVRKLKSANQALCLQKLSYWLERATNEYDGYVWVFNTYEEWAEDLGLSASQVERAMITLEEMGLVITVQPEGFDRRKWYRIDTEHEFWKSAEVSAKARFQAMDDTISGNPSREIVDSTYYTKTTSKTTNKSDETAIAVIALAEVVARRWWEKQRVKPLGKGAWHSLLQITKAAEVRGYNEQQIELALDYIGTVPTMRQMDLVLRGVGVKTKHETGAIKAIELSEKLRNESF